MYSAGMNFSYDANIRWQRIVSFVLAVIPKAQSSLWHVAAL